MSDSIPSKRIALAIQSPRNQLLLTTVETFPKLLLDSIQLSKMTRVILTKLLETKILKRTSSAPRNRRPQDNKLTFLLVTQHHLSCLSPGSCPYGFRHPPPKSSRLQPSSRSLQLNTSLAKQHLPWLLAAASGAMPAAERLETEGTCGTERDRCEPAFPKATTSKTSPRARVTDNTAVITAQTLQTTVSLHSASSGFFTYTHRCANGTDSGATRRLKGTS